MASDGAWLDADVGEDDRLSALMELEREVLGRSADDVAAIGEIDAAMERSRGAEVERRAGLDDRADRGFCAPDDADEIRRQCADQRSVCA
jgi:hypothetical protein